MRTLEQLKEINLNDLNSQELNDLKNEVLDLPKEDLKEFLIHLFDNNIELDDETLDVVNDNTFEFLKSNEFKSIMKELHEVAEYESEISRKDHEETHNKMVETLTKNLNECNTLEDFKAFPGIMYVSNRENGNGLDVNFLKEKLKEKLTDAEYAEYLEYFKTTYVILLERKYTSQEKVNILMND